MTKKMISRRNVFSLLGLAAAFSFAVPTTMLTTLDAEAQAQPSAPATPAPATPAPASTAPATSGSATPGMERRHHASLQERLEARRATLDKRREAQRTARTRREARRKGDNLYMKSNKTTKQK
jgi:hypothetical protein